MISLETKAVCEALNLVEGAIIPQIVKPEGATQYEPLARGVFIEAVQCGLAAIDKPTVRFIDLGCGIGTNLLIAAALDSRVDPYGVEIVPEYCRVASILFGDRGHITQADIRRWDHEFGGYDFVFANHPLVEYAETRAMEDRIQTRMRSGSVFLNVGIGHGWEGWTQIHEHWPIFQKG